MINNITIESILSILCQRQDAHRATVIATNLDTEELQERYGSRIVSRLVSPHTVRLIPVETANVRLMNTK